MRENNLQLVATFSIAAIIIIGLAGSTGFRLSAQDPSAAALRVAQEDGCYYTTITEGDFVVKQQVVETGLASCTYSLDGNYDPYTTGYIEVRVDGARATTMQESCITDGVLGSNLEELSCSGNNKIQTLGTCTKGCSGGKCIKVTRYVKVCQTAGNI